jgi:hypothetical protein
MRKQSWYLSQHVESCHSDQLHPGQVMAGNNQPCCSNSNNLEFRYLVICTCNKNHQVAIEAELTLYPTPKTTEFFMVHVPSELTHVQYFTADGAPRRLYSTGEVTGKEYCHARKVSLMMCTFWKCTLVLLQCILNTKCYEKNHVLYCCAPDWLYLNSVSHYVKCICVCVGGI